MAIPFLSDIKLNGNQIKELVIDHKSSSQPTEGYHGQLIFRTDQNKIYVNASTTFGSPTWVSIAGDITSVGSGTTDQLTVTNSSGPDPSFSIVTAAVADSETGLATGDQIHTFVTGYADAAGTDNSTNVTLVTTSHDYLSISGQAITLNAIQGDDIADDAIDSQHYADGSIDTAHIADAQVTFAKMQHITSNRILGRTSAMAGDIEEITPANHRPFLKSALGGAFGSNALSIGTTADTVTIPGNLKVTGDTTYSNETIQIVDDNKLAFRAGDSDTAELILTADDVSSDKTITMPAITGKVGVFETSNALITATPAELNVLDGITSTTTELNILDGVTSTTTELNILDGVTATTTELNYVDGVTSGIQTQLDALEPASNKVTKKLSGSAATAYEITHGLGTQRVRTTVLDYGNNGSSATYEQVFVDVKNSTTSNSANNKITITFGTAPGASQDYLILVEKFPAIS